MTEPLDKVLQEFGERAVRQEPPTLQGLVNKWAGFVEEVENGYEFSIYDYTNDLSVRDLLAELLGRVDRSTQIHARQLLTEWDERFRFATMTATKTLEAAPVDAGWWWQRIPRDVKGELKEDLKIEGVLQE